ncbi:uncharacterized protein LOC116207507 [Punica granatum]|uniref:Uncharacterized protein n=2 Tax=Punica granatum TaxID=22663 RepID=A0A218W359_PUNGR|nr:uncharacterized protein LOC116207507 [Punica granatum]OWM67294.1 hypothetical protein CDL15_Pgr000746 [Punica granatum]PKI32142.1 hypothetical protein CRG98_047460 [Punica granatum]
MGDLFEGLPPPSANPQPQENDIFAADPSNSGKRELSPVPSKPSPALAPAPAPSPAPAPALKSALKRPKLNESNAQAAVPERRIRFKTTTDASEQQVIEAMKKISSHIGSPGKFSKAAKLAIQLIQAGSVKPSNSDYFFSILESAMSSPTACTDQSVRADYHALFLAAQDAADCLNKRQKNQLTAWTMRAVVANDLFTDDSFLFSKTATQIKEVISNLPVATESDDLEEATALKDEKESDGADLQENQELPSVADSQVSKTEESDPFGLDDLIPSAAKKDDKPKGKKDVTKIREEEEEENRRFLKLQREALVTCLEIAARRYKTPWCQTVIDILVKHAFDNISRFTSKQREAIEKLWASIREQQARRKQGKSVNGKLDVNAFEWLQQKYATEKISIRHAVGGSGDRHCEQWLG